MLRTSLLSAAVLLSLAGCAGQGQKAQSATRAEAGIPFTEMNNIYDWRADGSAGIYIQTDRHDWYHATFMAPCNNLPFTEHVDIHSTPGLSLSKFDSIEVRGEDCYFRTMEQVPGPPAPASKPAKP